MKTILHSVIALSTLLAAGPAVANPFTARPLPAGFSVASAYNNGAVDTLMVEKARAAVNPTCRSPAWN